MNLLTGDTPLILWQEVIKDAEASCAITLQAELETYLVSLLDRYTNKPELASQVFATAFMQAAQLQERQRHTALQHVGDQCLLYAGLFPHAATRRLVKINYFVDLGRAAYHAVSLDTNDLYGCLALQFVSLMDVLQSIRQYTDFMPLEAYEQWESVGSLRALKLLKLYTHPTNHNH